MFPHLVELNVMGFIAEISSFVNSEALPIILVAVYSTRTIVNARQNRVGETCMDFLS